MMVDIVMNLESRNNNKMAPFCNELMAHLFFQEIVQANSVTT